MGIAINTSFTLAAMLLTTNAFAFGGKPMNLAELKGPSEAQVAAAAEGKKLNVMLRGTVAEVLFQSMHDKKQEPVATSEALAMVTVSAATQVKVQGEQFSCSRIMAKDQKADYACAFDMGATGDVVAAAEAFNPQVFNLAYTKIDAPYFAKKAAGGRGLASVAGPASVMEPTKSYVVYGEADERKAPEHAMVVFKGKAAAEMRGFLETSGQAEAFEMNGVKGLKGKEVSCVEATAQQTARCAMVINLADGSVTTKNNPLFN